MMLATLGTIFAGSLTVIAVSIAVVFVVGVGKGIYEAFKK